MQGKLQMSVCLVQGGSDDVPVQQLNPRVPHVACNS